MCPILHEIVCMTLNVTENFPMYKKKIRFQQENSQKNNFPTTKKMTQPHNCIVH